MNVFAWELKKIWNAKMLLLVAIACSLFFITSSMDFCIKTYPNGHPAEEKTYLLESMKREYGNTLEDSEFLEIIEQGEQLLAGADAYIRENPVFAGANVYSYTDFQNMVDNSIGDMTQRQQAAYQTLVIDGGGDWILYKVQAIDSISRQFKYAEFNVELGIEQAANYDRDVWIPRFTQILETEEWRNISNPAALENMILYVSNLTVLCVLAVMLLVSPLVSADRAKRVNQLQYVSKTGRRVLQSQFWATVVSAFTLTTLLLLFFGAVYFALGPGVRIAQYFWDSGTVGLNGSFLARVPMTCGQYIMLRTAAIYPLSMCAAALAFILSRFSGNMIALIAKLIPAFIVCTYIYGMLLDNFAVFRGYENKLVSAVLHPLDFAWWSELAVCAVLFLLGLLAAWLVRLRERRVDL